MFEVDISSRKPHTGRLIILCWLACPCFIGVMSLEGQLIPGGLPSEFFHLSARMVSR